MRNIPRSGGVRLLIAVGATVSLVSCERVPPPDEMASGPTIDQVVQRVKCDLYQAVAPRLEAPYGYEWLHDWTVQANLNLIVNDQAALAPTVAFTQPLTTESIPLRVTNAARSWNFGIGASAGGTATRNETITFTVSFAELMSQFGHGHGDCNLPDAGGLQSDLGIKEWIEASLAPAEDGYLKVGYHKAPKTGTGGATAAASASAALKSVEAKIVTPGPTPKGTYDCDVPKSLPPRRSGPPSRAAIVPDLVHVRCDLFSILALDFSKLDGGQVKTIALTVTDIQRTIADLLVQGDSASKKLAHTLEQTAIELAVFLDPPIDALAHQVQFIIVLNANASPSWILLHFKGPSSSGPLFSVTTTKTHTLNIAIGPPSSPDTAGALNALQIGTAVSNSLTSTPP